MFKSFSTELSLWACVWFTTKTWHTSDFLKWYITGLCSSEKTVKSWESYYVTRTWDENFSSDQETLCMTIAISMVTAKGRGKRKKQAQKKTPFCLHSLGLGKRYFVFQILETEEFLAGLKGNNLSKEENLNLSSSFWKDHFLKHWWRSPGRASAQQYQKVHYELSPQLIQWLILMIMQKKKLASTTKINRAEVTGTRLTEGGHSWVCATVKFA